MSDQAPAKQTSPKKQAQHLAVVLVAAGSGSRMGGEVPKQFQDFVGQPMFLHSLRTLQDCGLGDQFVVVVPAGWEAPVQQQLLDAGVRVDAVVAGGDTRQQSVQRGLQAILNQHEPVTHVLIHEAARPFLSETMVRAVVAAVHETGASTLAIPVSDTLMRAGEVAVEAKSAAAHAEELVDRDGVWAIQTPQVFDLKLLLQAHEQAAADRQATDDGSLVLDLGVKLRFVRVRSEHQG